MQLRCEAAFHPSIEMKYTNKERKHTLNEQVAQIPMVAPPVASTASSMATWNHISCYHFPRNVTWPEIHFHPDTNVRMEIRNVVFQFSKNK